MRWKHFHVSAVLSKQSEEEIEAQSKVRFQITSEIDKIILKSFRFEKYQSLTKILFWSKIAQFLV